MAGDLTAYIRRNHAALIALFVVLGGTSYAAATLARNSVTTREVKNGSLRSVDFARRQLRAKQGPRGRAGSIGDAGLPGVQGDGGSKGARGAAGPPGPTVTLDAWTAPLLGSVHCVGSSSEADGSWVDWGPDTFGSTDAAGFYKDPLGIVHLKGRVRAIVEEYDGSHPCPPLEIFTLPTGYRPSAETLFNGWSGTPAPAEALARIDVLSDGRVGVKSPTVVDGFWISLDGITFRAGS